MNAQGVNTNERNYVSLYNKYRKEYNEYTKRINEERNKRLISERKENKLQGGGGEGGNCVNSNNNVHKSISSSIRKKDNNVISNILHGQSQINAMITSGNNAKRLSLHEHNNGSVVTEMNIVNSDLKTLRKLNTMNNNISTSRKRNYDDSLDNSNSNNVLLNTRAQFRDTTSSNNYYSSVIETEGNANGRSTMLNQYNGISRMSNTLYAHKRKVVDSLSLSNFHDNNTNTNIINSSHNNNQRKRKPISSLSPSNDVVNVHATTTTATTINNNKRYKHMNSIENDCITYRNNKANMFFNDIDSNKPRSQFSSSMKTNKNYSTIDKAFPRTKTFHHISKLKDKPFTSIMLNNNKSSFTNNNVFTTHKSPHKKANKRSSTNNETIHQLTHYTFPSLNILYTPTNTHHNHKQYLHYQQQSSTLTKPFNHITHPTNTDLQFATNNNMWLSNNNTLLSTQRVHDNSLNYINTTSSTETKRETNNNNNSNNSNNPLNLILNLNSSTSTTTSTTIHNNNPLLKADEQDEFTKLMQAVSNIELTTKAITSLSSTSPKQPQSSYIFHSVPSSFAHISFHLISSYNIYAGQIGLTEIQLYDINNSKIPIIHAYATSITTAMTNRASLTKIGDINRNLNTILIKKLFNNKYHTVNEHDMWLSPFAPDLKVEVFIDRKVTLKKIVIWNYNAKDVSKGVKDIAVYQKDAFIWKGIVNKGCYDDKKDYSTVIDVHYWNGRNNNRNSTNSNDEGHNAVISDNNKFYTARKSFHNTSTTTTTTNSARNKLPLSTHMLLEMNSMNNSFNIANDKCSNTQHKKTLFTSSNLESPSKPPPPLTSNKYITFNHIIITLTSNYGHCKYIGLTGIQFYDERSNLIDIETAFTIGANPKDINSYYNDPNDNRIFENVFNNKTQTCNDDQMWLTLRTPNEHFPYIELTFTHAITLSKIKFYNYNAKNDLDKCVKTLNMKFYLGNDTNAFQTIDNVVLYPGIGESGVDYGQEVVFPYTKHFTLTPNELEPYMQVKLASFLYEQCYETPYLPCGFVLRFSFVSNYGNSSEIGVDKIEVYDQLGRDVIAKYRSKIRIESNGCKVNSSNRSDDDDVLYERTEVMLKYNNNNANERNDDDDDDVCERYNNVYMFFRIPIGISYIRVVNHRKEPSKGVKDVKVFMDTNVIYEGYLYKAKEENESESEMNCNDKGETLILFTCDMGITKYLDDMYIAKPLTRAKRKETVNPNGVVLQL